MERARISFPIEIHGCALELGIDIVRLDRERAIQSRFLLRETAKVTITEGNLLQSNEAVERIQLDGTLQATHCLFLFALATLNVTLQLEETGIVRQSFGCYFEFGHSAVIVEIASIKVLRTCQVCLTRIRTEAKCRPDCRFS